MGKEFERTAVDATNVSAEDIKICDDLTNHTIDRFRTVMNDMQPMYPHPVGVYIAIRKAMVYFGSAYKAFSSPSANDKSDGDRIRTGMAIAMLDVLAQHGSKEAYHVMHQALKSKNTDGRELCRMLSQLKL